MNAKATRTFPACWGQRKVDPGEPRDVRALDVMLTGACQGGDREPDCSEGQSWAT